MLKLYLHLQENSLQIRMNTHKESAIFRNNVSISGNLSSDKVMLFAHGYGCDQNMWRFLSPTFQHQYKIVLFDHVGSENSDADAYDSIKYSSLEGYAQDVIEICEALNLQNICLVCHSVSAMIGAIATIQKPDLFSSLIMVCPSPCYINSENYFGGFSQQDIQELLEALDSNYLGWSSFITPVMMANPEQPELSAELNNSFCRNNPEIAKHFAKVTFTSDHRADLPKVPTPTLILQCSQDIIAPVEVGEYVHKNILNSKIVYLEATGHCPHLSSP